MAQNNPDPYSDPATGLLYNKVGATTHHELHAKEYGLTFLRRENLPHLPDSDVLSIRHLQAIHHHLFQDVYHWAGELRTVDIAKGTSQFAPVARLHQAADYCFEELSASPLLSGELSDESFVSHISTLFDNINYLHPFREGNGRTQRAFLDQVANAGGRSLTWRNVSESEHIHAAIQCFQMGSGKPYEKLFRKIIQPPFDGMPHLDESVYRVTKTIVVAGGVAPEYPNRARLYTCGQMTLKGTACRRRGQCPYHS